MSPISSFTNVAAKVTVSLGDNGSSSAGGIDFDDVLQQLYAIERECNKAIGELTQKVELLAKGAEATAGVPPSRVTFAPAALLINNATSSDATTASSEGISAMLRELQPSHVGPDSSVSSLASYMKATQSYTKSQVLPDFDAALLFATNS